MLQLLQRLSILVLFLILFLYPFFHHFFGDPWRPRLPPGSFGWCPFLGRTLSFIAPHLSSSRGRFLDYNIKRYGKIFRSHLFGHPTIVSCDAEFNSFVLQNEDRLFTSSYPKNIPRVLGDRTLLVVTGDAHKHLRGVVLNLSAAMSQNTSFLSDIEDTVIRVMESWRNKKTLVFAVEARKLTFSVIVKQILSLGPEDPETAEILNKFTMFMRGLVSLPINLLGTPYAKAIQAKHRIKAIVKTLWQQREKMEWKIKGRIDFLDVLLSLKELSEEEVLSQVLDLLLGGYETTAMLMAIIVKFLGHNPKMLSNLREEHRLVRQCKTQEERLGWDDFRSMQFTRCLINVVKFVHRKAIQPIQYKGFEIPAGWKVLPIFSGVHLGPSLYPVPPALTLGDGRSKKSNVLNVLILLKTNCSEDVVMQKEDIGATKKFMPFGGGKRLCPGSELARLETSFFLHHFVLNYSWTPLLDSAWPMSLPYLEFKNGLQIAIQSLTPRNV